MTTLITVLFVAFAVLSALWFAGLGVGFGIAAAGCAAIVYTAACVRYGRDTTP